MARASRNTTKQTVVRKQNVPFGTDYFEFSLIEEFDSYISSIDPSNVPEHTLVYGSQNVYKKNSGNISVRFGRKLWDSATDNTVAPIKSGFVWNPYSGTVIPLRVANAKLQFSSAISGTQTWYDLQTGLTLTRYVFDTWWDNTNKKDVLLFVRGDSNTFAWDGGIALFVSAIASTSITLDRDPAVSGFAPTGTVTINGHNYAYTGIDSANKKLTGVTGDASGEAVNSVSYSAVTTKANTPASGFNNDFIKVVNNQLYSGSYTSRVVYLSKNTDYTDHTHSTPRLTGEGDTIILDQNGKGIGTRQNSAYIFGGTSDLYPITFNQNVGATTSETTNRGKIQLGNLMSALGHEFIDGLGDNIIYLDQSNQVRNYGTFTDLFKDKPALMSLDVQDELHDEDFTGGQLKIICDRGRNVIYVIAPNSGKTYLYQELELLDAVGNIKTERIWQPPFVWNISRIDSIVGIIYGFSNSNPQIYQLWDTGQWHDDSPSGQLPYNCIMLMAYWGGRRQGKEVFNKIYYEGYATSGTPLFGAIYGDYQGSTKLWSLVLNDPKNNDIFSKQFTGIVPPSLGDASLGDNPLGEGVNITTDQQKLPKFKQIIDVPEEDVFEYALMIYSNSADARWEILALGTNAVMSDKAAIEIKK